MCMLILYYNIQCVGIVLPLHDPSTRANPSYLKKRQTYDIKKLREGVVKCVSTSAIGNSVPLDVGAQQLTAIMS